jgi:hypothetical protein
VRTWTNVKLIQKYKLLCLAVESCPHMYTLGLLYANEFRRLYENQCLSYKRAGCSAGLSPGIGIV